MLKPAMRAVVDAEETPIDRSPAIAYCIAGRPDTGEIEYFRANGDKLEIDGELPERGLGEYPTLEGAVAGLRTNATITLE